MKLTQQQLASLLGCSAAAIVAWERDAGLPAGEDVGRERWYDGPRVVLWYVERQVARRAGTDPARQRLLEARAAAAELQLAKRLGEVLDRAEVERALRLICTETASAFLAAPPRLALVLAALTDSAAIERLLTDDANATLSRLADRMDALAAGGASDRGSAAG